MSNSPPIVSKKEDEIKIKPRILLLSSIFMRYYSPSMLDRKE
jgi:hypothetical protein